MGVKGSYPFKIGCTSYVIPDAIIPNVEFMADKVDDIELVLFESQEASNLPDSNTVLLLQQIGRKENVTYSIHFPIDLHAGAPDKHMRNMLLDRITAIITATAQLPVSGYLLHFEGLSSIQQNENCTHWYRRVEEFCFRLTDKHLVDPSLICIENLSYPPELHAGIVKKYSFSNCIDLGHLWLQRTYWESYVNDTLPATKIIHLHGVDPDRKDHQSLSVHNNTGQLNRLVALLKNYTGILTLEVFSEHDTFESLKLLEELWQKSSW
jgi:sugar phosphate isomerase/epimerase